MKPSLLARLVGVHVLVAIPASAQDAAAPPPHAPLAQSAPPPDGAVTVAPREGAATVLGSYTCILGEHAGVDAPDADTTADVVCHALDAHRAHVGTYDLRIGKLGTRLLFVVTERESGDERRLFINGIEEVPVASDRLVDALVTGKKFDETLKADNVVSAETVTPKQRTMQASLFMGISGMGGLGGSSSPSAGVQLDLDFRLQSFSLVMQGRAGGIGSASDLLSYATLGGGARYFLSDGDTSTFLGAGASLAYFQANQTSAPQFTGSGLAGYGEIGVAFLRSSKMGALVSLRADVPMFSLTQQSNEEGQGGGATQYIVPVSINLGLLFH